MATPVTVTATATVAIRNGAAMEIRRKSGKAVKEITKKSAQVNFLDMLGRPFVQGTVYSTSTHINLSDFDSLCLLIQHKSTLAVVACSPYNRLQLIIPIILLIIGIDYGLRAQCRCQNSFMKCDQLEFNQISVSFGLDSL